MELQLHTFDKGKGGQIALSDDVFAREYNEPLVHQVVTAYLAGGRQGTKAQKTRSEARGGGTKPWNQKGTGRARAGTIRSPIWRGGGRAFAAKPRKFDQKVNRKMYRSALRSIVSELIRQDRLLVVDSFNIEQPKTKLAKQALDALGVDDVLIVTDDLTENLYLAVRNIPRVDVIEVASIDPVALVSYDKLVITVKAVAGLEAALK
ncbi:MAG: 50S ribosomal protein L4 [Gammaproteobacteria bacterium]|nr:50S ribosomal protein L4 [Gammaproteobacteria bacterium]MCZ6893545.1 50S ribosomal protein L4 [Gammaproteobacteria bacterium]